MYVIYRNHMLIYCRFHWVLAIIDPKSQIVYYLDSQLQQPYQDLKDIVNM